MKTTYKRFKQETQSEVEQQLNGNNNNEIACWRNNEGNFHVSIRQSYRKEYTHTHKVKENQWKV